MYAIKEIFKTIQGEGALAGRVAVFCRFAGCNLWSGREADRETASCSFCDTDFVGGEKFETADELINTIEATWGKTLGRNRMIVFTGGEPALQLDMNLLRAARSRQFFTAIETNGTIDLKAEPDWICVSPKAGTTIKEMACDELKVVWPQNFDPNKIAMWPRIKSIQPMDGPELEANIQAAISYCLEHPEWRLSLQLHKMVGIR